ncbi:hypothetical protein J3F83DRAFT_77723 [Trichoderma novae-zelandiae]
MEIQRVNAIRTSPTPQTFTSKAVSDKNSSSPRQTSQRKKGNEKLNTPPPKFASPGSSVIPGTHRAQSPYASTCEKLSLKTPKMGFNHENVSRVETFQRLKLKRTDTTLDLSQKAKRAREGKKRRRRREEKWWAVGGLYRPGSCALGAVRAFGGGRIACVDWMKPFAQRARVRMKTQPRDR